MVDEKALEAIARNLAYEEWDRTHGFGLYHTSADVQKSEFSKARKKVDKWVKLLQPVLAPERVVDLVDGAVYLDGNKNKVTLCGVRQRTVAVQDEQGNIYEVSNTEFNSSYYLTDNHNHEEYCCTVHGTHAEGMHRGCILR